MKLRLIVVVVAACKHLQVNSNILLIILAKTQLLPSFSPSKCHVEYMLVLYVFLTLIRVIALAGECKGKQDQRV